MAPAVRVGTLVRVPLHGRRMGGWVVADDVVPPEGVALREIAKVTGWGPPADVMELAGWAAWRWAGRRASFLRTASPHRAVRELPASRPGPAVSSPPGSHEASGERPSRRVVRLPPAADRYPVVLEAVARGNALLLVPSVAGARLLARKLRRDGLDVALLPDEWARARSGATVIGTRAAAWAPVADMAAVVVVDEHDETWQQEQAPTWNARDVAFERARRAGVPCTAISPCPSLEALAWGELVTPSRADERAGWPVVEPVDRREDEPGRTGLISERLAQLLRGGERVACVLNRKGRARLLACVACGSLARCERCEAAVTQSESGVLTCARCGTQRPVVCMECGSGRLKLLRPGVSRVREELAALTRSEVLEVTAETAGSDLRSARVVVGTEAVLHQLAPGDADVVVFLDFDQELLAPRYRSSEEAFALVAKAARLVGGRSGGGRVVLQTRMPDHEVVQGALLADPGRVSDAEMVRREALRYPPVTALAVVSGPSAPAYVENLGSPTGVEVIGPSEGRWLLRSEAHGTLLDALAATARPPGRLRIEVDPLRL